MREALIDTAAITANVRHLKTIAGTTEFIAVVKADGYGHGALRSARAAIAGGATRIGVADIAEALALRAAGVDEVPLLCWLHDPDEDFRQAVVAGLELGLTRAEQVKAVAEAVSALSSYPAAVHLKLETGLGRGGAAPADWSALFRAARQAEESGRVRVVGIFSHLSGASADDDLAQVRVFQGALAAAREVGLNPPLAHLAATAGTIALPEARFSAVRVGVGIYGLSPFADRTAGELGLRPAMTLRAPVAAVRRVSPGQGVSYDYTYRTQRETTLALIPLGYADGVDRHASGSGPVTIRGRRHRIAGRVAMDQIVVDVGDDPVAVGDVATLFGDPATDPAVASAADWAAAAGTINYEIVTRIGSRVVRREV